MSGDSTAAGAGTGAIIGAAANTLPGLGTVAPMLLAAGPGGWLFLGSLVATGIIGGAVMGGLAGGLIGAQFDKDK